MPNPSGKATASSRAPSTDVWFYRFEMRRAGRTPAHQGMLLSSDDERGAQREFQFRFRRNVQLLALGQNLNGCCSTAANSGTDCGTLLTTGDRADHRANRGAAADTFRGLSAARLADFRILGSCDRVRNAVDHDLRQLETEF